MDNPINTDWTFYGRKVEVYKVVTSMGDFYVSLTQGDVIKGMLVEQEGKDRFITIGDATIRLFTIQALLKEEKKFYDLPQHLQVQFLQKGEVFTQEELSKFSEKLQARLRNLAGGKLLNG